MSCSFVGRGGRSRRVAACVVAALLVVGFSGLAEADPGVVDDTYGVDGFAAMPASPGFPASTGFPARVVTTASGASWVYATGPSSLYYDQLVRLAPDGSVVGSISFNTLVPTNWFNTSDPRSLVVAADGEAAWVVLQEPEGNSILARVRPDVTLDPAFGGDGVLDVGTNSYHGTFANDLGLPVDTACEYGCGPSVAPMLALSGDGGVFVVVASGSNWSVAKVRADGTLDPGFATAGLASIGSLTGLTDYVRIGSLHRDSSGRLVVVNRSGALRLLADGSVDPSYGTGEIAGVARFTGPAGWTGEWSCSSYFLGTCSSTMTADGTVYLGASTSVDGALWSAIISVDPSGVPTVHEFCRAVEPDCYRINLLRAASDGSTLFVFGDAWNLRSLPIPLPPGGLSPQTTVEDVGGGFVFTGAPGPGSTVFVAVSPSGNPYGISGIRKVRFGPAAPTDTTPPDISVTASPEALGGEYATGEPVGLSVECTDPGPDATSVTECEATVVDGHPASDPGGGVSVVDSLPTSGAGDRTLFVHAVDGAGNESTFRHEYTVVEGVGGTLAGGVQQRSASSSPGSVDAAITAPTGGAFRLLKEPTAATVVGHQLFAQQVRAHQPAQTAAAPASLELGFDPTLLGGTPASQIKVFRDGTAVANCAATSLPAASPDPCVQARATVAGGRAKVTVLSSTGGTWTFGKLTAVAPSAPTGVSVVPGAKTATVDWTAPSSDGGAPISASVITAVPEAGSIDPATGLAAVTRTKTVTGDATTGAVALSTGVAYDVTVRSRNGLVSTYSPSSTSVRVTPLAVPDVPEISSVEPGSKSAVVSWSAPLSASSVTGYTVVATPTAGGAAITKSVSAAAVSYALTGLANATEYNFTVAAKSAAGTSAPSPSVVATTYGLQGPPAGVAAEPAVRKLTVTWTPPTSQSPITGYTLVAAPTAGGAAITKSVSATAVSYALTGLANDTEYSVTVASKTAVGTSDPSDAAVARTPALPVAPAEVTATPGASSATLTWDDAAVDVAYPIIRYTVRLVATRPDASTHTITKNVNGTLGLPATSSLIVSGLEPGLTYSTEITATNAVGAGPVSAGSDVTPFNGLSVVDVAAVEGTAANASIKSVSFTVRLSSKATSDVSFTAATLDGTAVAPGDYVALPSTVFTIPAGSTTRTVTVKVARDSVDEPDETLHLVLSDASGAVITRGTAVLTLTDDD